jgi:hypothetical protein
MATSGTTTFNLDINEICEEAFERAGLELRTGFDMRTARRSLNLMMLDWSNKGINLWQIQEGTTNLTEGTQTYTLDSSVVDLLEHVIRTNGGDVQTQTDLQITRISNSTYSTIPNKLTKGRPAQIWIDRQRAAPVVYLWPTASSNYAYTGGEQGQFVYWYIKRIEDTGIQASNEMDIAPLFIPALVAGLAYNIALKKPEAAERVVMLKQMYDEAFQLCADENRVKATLSLIPFTQGFYGT